MDRRVLTVDTKGLADFTSISDALRAAVNGDIIALRMGLFEEKVIISKEIELTTDRDVEPGEAIVNSGLIVAASGVTVRNIFVQQQVDVRQGSAHFTNCDLSQGADGIRVLTGASARLTNCKIHNVTTNGDGVYVQEGAKADLENCEIFDCRVNGVHVKGGDLLLRSCTISGCDFGVYFRKAGHGAIEDCTLDRVRSFAVYITGGSDPLVARNNIKNADIHGIMVAQQGGGVLRDNNVEGSVRILRGCTPILHVNNVSGRLDNETVQAAPVLAA
jgi:parallel beta-helix repeat protein